MFNLLKAREGEMDAIETERVVRERFPGLARVDRLGHFIGIVMQVARLVLGKTSGVKEMAQHLWLFELAGRLKGALPETMRADSQAGVRLAPLSLLFVDAIEMLGGLPMGKRRIQWDDADAVQLEFEEIWYKRKFPKGSPYLDDAVAFAFENPLNLEGNLHYVRLINVAYFLQQKQPGLPILLPISGTLASRLRTTPVTLGTAVSRAVREGILEIVDGHYDLKAGKARSFRLNLDHPILQGRHASIV